MSVTSANATLTITIPGLFPAPVRIEGFSSDRFWNTDSQNLIEAVMGVDGRMTGGYVPSPIKQTLTLMADSPSKAVFVALVQAMRKTRDIYRIYGSITLPGTKEAYTLTRGMLTDHKPIPDAGKILGPLDFTIVWESVDPSVI